MQNNECHRSDIWTTIHHITTLVPTGTHGTIDTQEIEAIMIGEICLGFIAAGLVLGSAVLVLLIWLRWRELKEE